MNMFVHRSLGHFLMKAMEEGGEGGAEVEQGEESEEEKPEEEAPEQEEEEDDSVVVTIGDEAPAAEEVEEKTTPKWVKDLRKTAKEQAREIRELKAAAAKSVPEVRVPELGAKPTLDDCDYDADVFEQKLTAWHDRKRQIDQVQADAQKQQETQDQEWQSRLDTYGKAKGELKVRDFEEAESNVLSTLSVTQQGIIVQGADNSALVVYALGKNPVKAKELAGITDAVKFAFAIAKLETQLKVQAKKSVPAPEGKVRGSAAVSGSVDSSLERLRADAEKTGDYSKVTAYRKQQREKSKA